jgi:NAD+ synthase
MKIDCPFAARILAAFIKEELAKFGFKKGILGLSGGLDSTVCAFLAARALGPKNLFGLIMPYGKSFGEDVRDAVRTAELLKIRHKIIDVAPMVDVYFERYPTENRVLRGNKIARERMSILYDFSAREKALILGTSNKTELLIGYGTIHGDLASAINPMGDLYKTQVRQMARYLEVPEKIQKKRPTAGLWAGQTDEGEIGMTYAELDEILFHLVDERESKEELLARGFSRAKIEKIVTMIKNSEFKRKLPPIAKISSRTIGHDFLYPYDWDK